MKSRERLREQIESLDEPELERLTDFIAFLRFKARSRKKPLLSDAELETLYEESAEEDLMLAEAGIEDYAKSLSEEDGQ